MELDIWSHIGWISQNAENFCSLNSPLIVRIRVPSCRVNIKNHVFYVCFLASNGIAHCATTSHWQQSCWASDIFIWCEKNQIKHMIYYVHTARGDTYPYNEPSPSMRAFDVFWIISVLFGIWSGRLLLYNSAFLKWTKSLMHFGKDVSRHRISYTRLISFLFMIILKICLQGHSFT